jgi:Fe-S oxidoreductase
MERVGIEEEEEEEEEEGNHLRKEPVPYCELQGICTIACERDIHVGAPLMSIRHLLHCNLCP